MEKKIHTVASANAKSFTPTILSNHINPLGWLSVIDFITCKPISSKDFFD
jgi:hypothetical protein